MITEIAVTDRVTAVLSSHLESGENFDGPVLIGFYSESSDEIWVEFQHVRQNIQIADVAELCKQLKRAAKLAKETSHD